MSSVSQPNVLDDVREAAVDQVVGACDGDARAAIRALVVANDFLESEIAELMKAISHACVRGRFRTYTVWMLGYSEVVTKHQDRLSFVRDDQAEQMSADMAIQSMLMILFQVVSFAGLR